MKRFIFFFLLFLNAAAAQTRTGRDYAVFFYVTDFKPGWAALPETKTEAETLKKELEDNFGFTCELVANPTKQQMLDKIRQYNDRLTENDQVLFFFSMHGHFDAEHDRGYLIGKDGLVKDEYGDTWLNYDDLRTNLTRSRAKHVLLALDACHSGSFGIRNKSRPDAPVVDAGMDCAAKVSKTMRYAGRQYCTSGNKLDKTPAKSLFAARFLEALRKGGEGGVVHFDDLEYYLGKVDNPKPESGTFGKHDPGGDFVFMRKNACSAVQSAPAKNTTSEAEEQVWKIAQRRNDGQIYLDEYPNGKYAAQAQQLKVKEVNTTDRPVQTKPESKPSNEKPNSKGTKDKVVTKPATTTLEGTTWYLEEIRGMAISTNLTLKPGGKAIYQQSNSSTGILNWSGTPSNLIIKGPWGESSTIQLSGDINTGQLNYSITHYSGSGQSGTQTGQYKFTKIQTSKH
jgi:formylglycine-generating enzyme